MADARAVGTELGARYVMEGSLRQAGAMLRVAVQLVDATSGAHLWAETYDRPFVSDEIFALQDDLVPRIVSTVADMDGVLPHSMAEALRGKSDDQLSPHEAVLRYFSFLKRITPEEHAQVRQILERVTHQLPGPRRLLGNALGTLHIRVPGRIQRPARSPGASIRGRAPRRGRCPIKSPLSLGTGHSAVLPAGVASPSGRPQNVRSNSIGWTDRPSRGWAI